ncbi:MAG: NUDIX hydrolase [Bacillota bacterium]
MKIRIRTSGVAINDRQVLLHDMDHFWVLPGGGVESVESSIDALKREFKEELGIEVNIKRLIWVIENFFEYNGQKEKSTEFYYLIEFPLNPEIYNKANFEGFEKGANLKLNFKWQSLEEIDDLTIVPECLPGLLKELINTDKADIKHIVHKSI